MNVASLVGRGSPGGVPRSSLAEFLRSDAGLTWLTRRLAVTVVLLVVAFVGYYTYDRYLVRVDSPLDQSVRELEDSVRQNPNDPELRVRVANAYMRQKRVDAAISQYQEALTLRKDWQPALLAMAEAELSRGNEQQTEAIYLKVADANRESDYRYANRDLGLVYYRLAVFANKAGRHEDAVTWAREALLVDRTDADVLLLLGSNLETLGRLDEAAMSYRRAISFDPGFREAFAALRRVDLANGDQREAAYAGAMEQVAAGDLDAAIAGLSTLVGQAPDYAEAYEGLGLAYGKKGQRQESQQAFRQALERNPNLLLAQWSVRTPDATR